MGNIFAYSKVRQKSSFLTFALGSATHSNMQKQPAEVGRLFALSQIHPVEFLQVS